jgi:hypothetical protein
MRGVFILLLGLFVATSADAADLKSKKSEMVGDSLELYRASGGGNCACPTFEDSIGRKCGGRSAWCLRFGREPLCYDDEITDEKARQYSEMQTGDLLKRDRSIPSPHEEDCHSGA